MVTRREFLGWSAAAVSGARLAAGEDSSSTVDVRLEQGTLRGQMVNGVRVFRGVPFAEPPVGPLRFCPPQPPRPWTGVRDATKFAAASLQPEASALRQSEDCLYLNVWAPAVGVARQKEGCPVFVWIHGGGFTGGHSFDPLSDGTGFARDGVIVVTVAYRLGALGFLDVSPLLGPRFAGSANNALRDLVAALQWVQRHIHAFGGDPRRVTVGGESAGAKLTDILMGVPEAVPLFQQAISESGGAERVWTEDRAREVGAGFGKVWTEQTHTGVESLLTAPARQIVEAQVELMRVWPAHFPLRGELEGGLLPAMPLETIRGGAGGSTHGGSTRGKRLLLGTNRDESALFLGPHPQKPVGAQDLGNLSVERFAPVAARYRELFPEMTEEGRRIRSVTAEEYLVPSIRVAEAHIAGGGGEAFVYRLDFPGQGRFAGLAFHSLDLRFVWNYFGREVPSEAEQRLAAAMHGAWTTFLQGRAPAAEGLPAWPAYSLAARPTMIFDVASRVENDPEGAELALWDGLLRD